MKRLRSSPLLLLALITVSLGACATRMEQRELDSAHAECAARYPQIDTGAKETLDVVMHCFEPKEFAIKQKYEPDDMDLVNLYFAERRAVAQAYDNGTMSRDQLVQSLKNLHTEYDDATEQRATGRLVQAFIAGVAVAAQARASMAPVQSQTYNNTPVMLHTTCQWVGTSIAGFRPQFNCTTTN